MKGDSNEMAESTWRVHEEVALSLDILRPFSNTEKT